MVTIFWARKRGCQEIDCQGESKNGNQREHEGREDPKKDGWIE
jgi:hypothetical protein